MSLSFYAFLRPGEVTSSHNNLMLHQVLVSHQHIPITFYKFKHHQGPPITIVVNSQNSFPCPVKLASSYLTLRGKDPGPCFSRPDGHPITYNQYSAMFSQLQNFMSDSIRYHPYGFRIGAATYASIKGIPEDTIRHMGRWSSDAVRKYIRIQSFNV